MTKRTNQIYYITLTTPTKLQQHVFAIRRSRRQDERSNKHSYLPGEANLVRSLCRCKARSFGEDVFPPIPAWRIISATLSQTRINKNNIFTCSFCSLEGFLQL